MYIHKSIVLCERPGLLGQIVDLILVAYMNNTECPYHNNNALVISTFPTAIIHDLAIGVGMINRLCVTQIIVLLV